MSQHHSAGKCQRPNSAGAQGLYLFPCDLLSHADLVAFLLPFFKMHENEEFEMATLLLVMQPSHSESFLVYKVLSHIPSSLHSVRRADFYHPSHLLDGKDRLASGKGGPSISRSYFPVRDADLAGASLAGVGLTLPVCNMGWQAMVGSRAGEQNGARD